MSFTWLGGSMSSPSSWGPQPDPMHPVEPGPSNEIIFNGTGTLTGSVGPSYSSISGTFDLEGSITAAGSEIVNSGSFTIESGATFSGGSELIGSALASASVIQKGGTSSLGLMEFNAGTYELDGGSLSVGSTGEYIADVAGSTATFTQKGGTHAISTFMILAYQGNGAFDLQGGTLSAAEEYIGQNGTGTFTQEGGTNTLSDRIVLGIDQNSGMPQLGEGTYTLGGSGTLSVQTIFIGSDKGCGGIFNFNENQADNAKLTVSATGGFPGLIVGGEGIGTFNLGHGTVSTTVAVGYRGTGDGTLILNAGTLSSTDEEIGVAGMGRLTQAGGANMVTGKGLILGSMAGSTGIYSLSAGTLQATSQTIGDSGAGTLNQTAGTNTVNMLDLIVGNASGSDGTYTLHSGTLTISAGNLTIGSQADSTGTFGFNTVQGDNGTLTLTKGSLTVGDAGTGTFTMAAGMLSSDLTLGSETGGSGTFTLTGGAFTATDVDEVIGDAGTGTFTQTAGTNTIDDGGLFLGNSNGGGGTYMLGGTGMLKITGGTFDIAVGGKSSGTFDFNTKVGDKATISIDTKLITVGVHGMGTVIQGDGKLGAKIVVGGQVGSVGTFELDGGSVSAKGQVVGNNGAGTFTVNGAKTKDSITGNGDLILGAFAAGGGSFNLNAGTVTGGSELIGYGGAGAFVQKGGANKLSGKAAILDIGVQKGSIGAYTLSGGTLTTTLETIGDAGEGTFTQSGKTTHTVGGKLIIGNNAGTGTFTLSGGTVTVKGTGAAVALGVKAKSVGTLTVTHAKLTTPSLAIGAKGAGHVSVGVGATITVTKSMTIATGGTLTVVKGSVNIGSGAKSKSGTISVGKGGSLSGAGTVTAGISELTTGSIQAKGGVLSLIGPVSGGGTIGIAGHATLDIGGKDANAVKFLAATGTLKLEKTGTVAGKIMGLQIGDVIDIAGSTITKATLSGSTLTLDRAGGGAIALTVIGSFTGDTFTVQSDGHGGTDVLLRKASAIEPNLSLFGQYVAAGFSGVDAAPSEGHIFATQSADHLELANSHA